MIRSLPGNTIVTALTVVMVFRMKEGSETSLKSTGVESS